MVDRLLSQSTSLPALVDNNFENELSLFPTKVARIVEQATPAAGQSFTLANLTGVGVVKMLQFTLGRDNDAGYNNVLEVYVDGETIPSISVDIGTLLLTHNGGHATAQAYGTKHMLCVPYGPSQSNAMSGGIFFPIPYANGCIIKIRAPAAGACTGSGYIFGQVVYAPGQTSKYRLRSAGVPWLSKQTYAKTDQILFCDIPNVKGSVVYHSIVAQGTTGMQYLERCQWLSVDAECGNETFDGFGIAQTGFTSSGGEDLFLAGWYFAGLGKINGLNFSACSISNNGSYDTCAAIDMLAAYGGIPFNTRFRFGWSLKDPTYLTSGHSQAWCVLYYVDTSAPFAPTVPQNVGATSTATQGTVTWTPPASAGSSFLTGYTVTLSPGGASQTVAANVLTATFSGLTTGQQYTASVVANSSIGSSAVGSTTFTPSVSAATWDFTTAALPGGVTATGGSNGTARNAAGNIVAATAPRFNYSAGACQGILIEPAATDLLLTSAQVGSGAWSAFGVGTGVAPTVTQNAGTSPDGTSDANQIAYPTWSGGGSINNASQVNTTLATTAGQTYTVGVWLKGAVGGERIILGANLGATPYTALGDTVCILTTSWQRFTLTFTATSTSTSIFVGQNGRFSDSSNIAAQTILAALGQVETGSAATSFIPTTTATVTRAADTVSGNVPAGCTRATINFSDSTSTTVTGLTAGASWTVPAQTKVVATIAFAA